MMRLLLALALPVALLACKGGRNDKGGYARVGGDPDRGEQVIAGQGCGACHEIPGIRGAHGKVGPPLDSFARRSFVAGELPNTPDNLVLWIQNPTAVHPRTAMPNLGLDAQAARDVAAYLYTLD